ncbi:MAG: metal-dependent hydrolase [Bacteroidetes bacterium]|nr:metal-dependent hydrolase [Bacteroidota bacterium]
MDSITHTALGACLGEVIAGRQLGKKAILAGIIANNIPDADVIFQLWMQPVEGLLAHRGFTHSILFVLLFSPALAFVFKKIFAHAMVSYKRWLFLFLSGLGLHIFIDAFTVYGTGWLEPFSHTRISFNSLFIIDPLFTLPLLLGTALLPFQKNSIKRAKWVKISLVISGIYFTAAALNKLHINKVVEKNISIQQLPHDDYMTTPTPFNNLLWYIIIPTKNKYYTGYYSVFDGNRLVPFQIINKNDSLLSQLCDSEELHNFIRFTKGYYCINLQNDSAVISDMRFGQNGGWYIHNAPFIFNFYTHGDKHYCKNLQQSRFESLNAQSIYGLIRRIKGKNMSYEK